MDNPRVELMRRALREHGTIRPFAKGKTFNDCFTRCGDRLVFRFVAGDGRGGVVSSVEGRVLGIGCWAFQCLGIFRFRILP